MRHAGSGNGGLPTFCPHLSTLAGDRERRRSPEIRMFPGFLTRSPMLTDRQAGFKSHRHRQTEGLWMRMNMRIEGPSAVVPPHSRRHGAPPAAAHVQHRPALLLRLHHR
jgi:hypothetical protein